MKFRKKPVVIEAFQMTRERRTDNSDWPEWLHRAWNEEPGTPGWVGPLVEGTDDGLLEILTLEGMMLVGWDDWIIKGVKGELYPCKPGIFEATYDAAQINDAFDGMTAAQVDDATASEKRIAAALGPEKYARTLPPGVKETATFEQASWAVGCVDGQVRILKDRDGLCARANLDDVARLADIVLGRPFKKAEALYVVLSDIGPATRFDDIETVDGKSVNMAMESLGEGRTRVGPFWTRPPFEPQNVKWRIDEHGNLLLWDVFNGIGIQTDQGRIGIAQRDSGVEVGLITPEGLLSWSSTEAWGNDPQEPNADRG